MTPPHLARLNPEQLAAVTTTEGPLLILAGAGSGKTRVLTRRIAHLLHMGADPESVLAVTFTNKSAAEMKERVAELVGEAGRKVWVSTFHSSCCRILRQEAPHLGYTRKFAIYDDDDQHRLLRQVLIDLGYDLKVVTPGSILSRIDHYKNRMVTVDDVVADHRHHGNEPLVRAWRAYEDNLRAADALDFNDLIGKTVELFDHHPAVLEKYRERFHYVLVDEYQDTNRAQYRLLRALVAERRNLAVVGDDDQSIYGFRGADIRNILDFKTDFPEATIVRLEQNYRSTEKILSVANAVVARNEDRIDKRLWTETTGGAPVSLLVADDPRAEARMVAQSIQQLARRGTSWSQIAIIYRTNATSQPFEAALRDLGIPYQVVGGRQFYSRREIRDALSYVRLVVNAADDAAFLRVVNVPSRGVGTAALTTLRAEASSRGEPLLKAARNMARGTDRASKAVATFVGLIDGLTDLARTASLPALVQQALIRSGYHAMLEAEANPEAEGRLENLRQLLRDAAAYEHPDPRGTTDEQLAGWLDRVSLAGADDTPPEEGLVTLMTVHTSKGLEFPVVFAVQMVEGQFPHSRSAEEIGGVEEERRLAYVAFTRAQKRLVVTRSRSSLTPDGTSGRMTIQAAAPSRFLFGIPEDSCEGDLPSEEGDQLRSPVRPRPPPPVEQRKLDSFVRWQSRGPAERPSGAYTTLDIESPSQLLPGVRVLHATFGTGDVIERTGMRVRIRFRDKSRDLPINGAPLQILRDT